MIDTDKYKGRTPGYWSVTSIRDGSIPWNTADEELCADAPLLLDFIVWVKNTHPHYYHKLTKAYQGAMSAKNNR
jgi:hypothetical protein